MGSGRIALGFMYYYVNLVGDQSPEGDRLLLPVGITVKCIFEKYIQFHPGSSGLKKSQFFGLWKDNFKHVSYQKVINKQSSINVYISDLK